MTLTTAETERIRDWLATHHLPSGLGTKEEACSIAAINLALTGELTDDIPECMSEAIGRWIIITQDRLADEARNSDHWKAALAEAAGTGRGREQEYLAVILDWMWERLALVQSAADREGYGTAWAMMLRERTTEAATAAATAATAAATATAYAATATDDRDDALADYDESAIALLERLVAM